MDKTKESLHSFHVLLGQYDCLHVVASVAVVEAGEKGAEEGTRSREDQRVRHEWFLSTFHMHGHVKVDQRN